jgi:hypothetical protein
MSVYEKKASIAKENKTDKGARSTCSLVKSINGIGRKRNFGVQCDAEEAVGVLGHSSVKKL